MHHPKACEERIMLPREQGERKIIDTEKQLMKQIQTIRDFFQKKSQSTLHSIIPDADQNFTPLNLQDQNYAPTSITDEQKQHKWTQKVLHGWYYNQLHQENVDHRESLHWAIEGYLHLESEEFLVAIQEQVKKILNAARSIRKKYLALKLERKEEDEALDRIINPITEPLREFVETTVGRKVQVKHEKVKLEAPKTYFESEPKLPRNVEFQPAEIIAQTSENLKSDDDDDDDGAEDVFYEPLQHLKEDLQKSIHDRSGAYEEFLDQYPKVAQEYVDRYYKQSDEIDHSYGLKHDMKTDDWSMGSQKVNLLPNGDIKVGGVSYKGTQGLYDLLFLKKPIYQTEDDKLQFTDILNRTNVHRRDFDPSKQVKGSTSSKYKQFVKPLVSTSSEAKRLKSKKLPFETIPENILKFETILDIKSYAKDSEIIFIIEVPLVEKENYNFVQLFPLPTPTNKYFKMLIPNFQYVIINEHNFGYSNTPCKKILDNEYLCKHIHTEILYKNLPCELQLLTYQHNITNCNPILVKIESVQVQNIDEGKWIVITDKEQHYNSAEVKKKMCFLNGTHLVEINFPCSLKIAAIKSYKNINHKFYVFSFT
ncbi:unnamed protein product [Ceutorhynchus assimilis]|uniref:DUF8207 domain-containing protein n=1 Tax=Ceutorhynchus assimilis TaxID=467358 RepID=A0A9N9QJK9_9CUCU|nr:unnamed protein product [Ceutorhynchus assimilis]